LASEYDVPGMPTTYLYARDGSLLGRHIGFRREDKFKLSNVIKKAIQA